MNSFSGGTPSPYEDRTPLEARRGHQGGDRVNTWARDPSNPVGGWYGTRKGYRGQFGMYMPPLLEAPDMVELTHDAKGNRTRARA